MKTPKANIPKRIYISPELEVVKIDIQITLQVGSPPLDPKDPPTGGSPIHEDQNTNSPWE